VPCITDKVSHSFHDISGTEIGPDRVRAEVTGMRNVLILFALFAFAQMLGAAAFAGDDTPAALIAVKSSQKGSGVITLTVVKDSKTFELQCNEGMPGCSDLKKGNYKMVELPKNHGIYDCKNVRVYGESATGSDDDEKLGEYCMLTK